ncbi:U7 snRNA-associated Sm-like protein LSm11 [Ranitomeya imitator]|uniref:U7 snRNA-associated Sm-like protein LSm11 n=1 Tax=Ranitomeya imitator TaxID=111125 RepID=UPI0037E85F48
MAREQDEVPECSLTECSLDVTSDAFDPLLALYSTDTPLPFPDVRCFNNLAEYESFLQRGGRPRSRSQKPEKKGRRPAPDPERVQRLKKLMLPAEGGAEQSRAPRRGRRPPRNVLTRMALLEGSPVGRLYRCVQERLRVHVHTRTFRGLRGVCSGFIVAFDKCWNLAMVDVDETYRRPVLGRAFYSEPQLTLPRLMARLRLQEDGEDRPAETGRKETPDRQPGRKETPDRQPGRKETPDRQPGRKETPDRQPGRKEKPDRQLERKETPDRQPGRKEKPDRQPGRKETPDRQPGRKEKPDCQPGRKEKPDRQLERKETPDCQPGRKEKPDYQRVYTRHIHQVFIRGESVLLVHVPE